jgi:hypothetical protein
MALEQSVRVVSRYLMKVAANPTAAEMVADAKRELDPIFKGFEFHVQHPRSLANEDGFMITFARAPEGSSEMDSLNAPMHIMVSIGDVMSHGPAIWQQGQPAPERIKAEQFRGRGIKMRAKTGTPSEVFRYVIQWFRSNSESLKGA